MSVYTGPGIYALIPMNALDKSVNAWGEATTPGTAIKLYSITARDNGKWEIVAAGGTNGQPEIGDREYHIMGVQSGLMLCAKADYSDVAVTLDQRSLKHGSCRWKLIPVGNGAYYIASAGNQTKWLSVRGGASADGTELMTYNMTEQSHFQFKFVKPT